MKISLPLGYLKTSYQLNKSLRRSVVLADVIPRMHCAILDTTLLVDRLHLFTTDGHVLIVVLPDGWGK